MATFNVKRWRDSNTIQFFIFVLAGGGLDIINSLVMSEDISWRSIVLMMTGLMGIALRFKTTQPIE